METPLLTHLDVSDYELVYEPAEDSFLLLDALEKDLPLLERLKPSYIVEIGSGSGVVITALAKKLSATCFATDINIKACETTQTTATMNGTHVECINMDLLTHFREHIFDVIVFNPPYVVTESTEIHGTGIERSWAGGIRGREVIDRLLPALRQCLSATGWMYLVTIEENHPLEICAIMERAGFESCLVAERRVRGEYLKVWRFILGANI